MHTYTYMYMCMHLSPYVYIHIYIYMVHSYVGVGKAPGHCGLVRRPPTPRHLAAGAAFSPGSPRWDDTLRLKIAPKALHNVYESLALGIGTPKEHNIYLKRFSYGLLLWTLVGLWWGPFYWPPFRIGYIY